MQELSSRTPGEVPRRNPPPGKIYRRIVITTLLAMSHLEDKFQ